MSAESRRAEREEGVGGGLGNRGNGEVVVVRLAVVARSQSRGIELKVVSRQSRGDVGSEPSTRGIVASGRTEHGVSAGIQARDTDIKRVCSEGETSVVAVQRDVTWSTTHIQVKNLIRSRKKVEAFVANTVGVPVDPPLEAERLTYIQRRV